MKIFILLLAFAISAPAFAADTAPASASAEKSDKTEKAEKIDAAPVEEKEETKKENELSCKFYTVKLPEDWKTVMKPTEEAGTIRATFAQNSGSPVVTLIVGSTGGNDAKFIASLFADQFKAPKPPVEKNGQYLFSFPQKNPATQKSDTARACVSVVGDEFMTTIYTGNQKDAQNFLKNNVISEKYSDLLPK